MYNNVIFIGGGRVTRILLKGLISQNVLPEKIRVIDPNKNTSVVEEFGLDTAENKSSLHEMLVASSELLFDSQYSTEEVLNMIPARPIEEEEENFRRIFDNRLTGIYSKLTKKYNN